MIPDFGSPQVGKPHESQILAATDCSRFTRAFSSEVGTGSRQENASNQKFRAPVPIPSERKTLSPSASKGYLAHLLQPSQTIFPVQ
jgi:hypothetical protein